MTLPALDVKAAAGVDVLASEVSQDIWAGGMAAWPATPRHLGAFPVASVVLRPDTQNCAKASPSSREISLG